MAILTLTTNNTDTNVKGGVTGSGTYDAGASITINATANDGYTFLSWVDSNGRVVSGDESYTFTINEDTTLQAIFMNNLGNVDIYAYCGANCKHKVLSAAQQIDLIQEMLANGGKVPTEITLVTPVNEIIDQNTGKGLKLFIGTKTEYEEWSGNKSNVFAIITDDKTKEEILSRLDKLDNSMNGILAGTIVVPKSNESKFFNLTPVIDRKLVFDWDTNTTSATLSASSLTDIVLVEAVLVYWMETGEDIVVTDKKYSIFIPRDAYQYIVVKDPDSSEFLELMFSRSSTGTGSGREMFGGGYKESSSGRIYYLASNRIFNIANVSGETHNLVIDSEGSVSPYLEGYSAKPSGSYVEEVLEGEELVLTYEVHNEGAVFDGWYIGGEKVSSAEKFKYIMPSFDIRITAKATY